MLADNKIRSFISIEIDENTKKQLAEISKKFHFIKGIKWVEPNNYHITLNFLGEIQKNLVCKISEILDDVSQRYPTFDIELTDFGFFPNQRRPKVFWIGIKNSEIIINIKKDLDELLKKNNIVFDEKPFKPHLTLGRFKEEINTIVIPENIKFNITFEVKSIHLMQSILLKQGPIYNVIYTAKLIN